MKRLSSWAVLALMALTAVGAAPKPVYDKAPPGEVMQDVVAYLSGEAMNSKWHVVASRTLAGKQMGTEPVYQWYLSFYAPAQNGFKLVYRLPNGNETLLSRVEKAHGAQMYFPMQQIKIIGPAELEQSGVQDVVVQVHQSGADCGSANVEVFGSNASFAVTPRAVVSNGCQLDPSIVKNGALQAVKLSGPYYAPNAAMCCPTKPKASALLSYSKGKWVVSPSYYTIQWPKAGHS